MHICLCYFFFFFNDTATPEIYTLPLHDALPIFVRLLDRRDGGNLGELGDRLRLHVDDHAARDVVGHDRPVARRDRKSTRLNSSHANISYAVFCLKKKKKKSSPDSHMTTQI